jgi:hypothetical protein
MAPTAQLALALPLARVRFSKDLRGWWHRRPGGFVLAGEVVEDSLGVPVTTRWWETLEKVAAIIEK